MLTWPHAASDWRECLDEIEPVYLQISRVISRHEPVLIICSDEKHVHHVISLLDQSGAAMDAIRCIAVPTNDTWIRDYGPLSVSGNSKPQLLDFAFDGWGGKYEATRDNQVSRFLFTAGVFNVPELSESSLVLEGGSLDTDGLGTLLTTSRCLLHSGRNPGMGKYQLETYLQKYLGVERTLWLDYGVLSGDDTESHVDMLARFCTPTDIAYLQCTDAGDEHYEELGAMEQQLRGFTSCDGNPYTLHPLPLPQPVYSDKGGRLPASYANFLIINHAVLVPVYNDPADDQALSVLRCCFPEREVLAINCLPLLQQYGSLHCATMQLPAGVLRV
jgi:agmatine/peptidylarginine deiminase